MYTKWLKSSRDIARTKRSQLNTFPSHFADCEPWNHASKFNYNYPFFPPTCRFSYQSDDYNYRHSLNMSFSFGDYNLEAGKYQYDALPVNNSGILYQSNLLYCQLVITFSIMDIDRTSGRCSLCNSTAAKILHLIVFGIALPTLFIVVPVYAKFVLYADTVVTFGASDMRLMDGHVSTSWCKVRTMQNQSRPIFNFG